MATPLVFGGFSNLEGGMNGGRSPSLIGNNQVAACRDMTFRGGFAHTRPPWGNLILTFDSATTQTHFTGIFQGVMFYQAEFGDSGFIVARGGRLFRIQLSQFQNMVSEITPIMNIVTTADFTVPAPAASVLVSVNSETPIAVSDVILIDSGNYTVTNRASGLLTLTYNGGAANAIAAAGAPVLTVAGVQIQLAELNPATLDFIYLFQAENFAIALAEQHSPVIYDGTVSRLAGIGEIPPGVMGIYAWGRIWIVFPNRRTFMAGDIVYGPSGTPSLAYRDAILKTTENTFLNEGGFFAVPNDAGPITAIAVLATQDTSLGIGPLLVGTSNSVFSVNAPIDRTIWKDLTYPIQTVSLIDYGPTGPSNNCGVNGDWWYRSVDGIRSFRVARREIDEWGNTPASDEIRPILDFDSTDMLYYGSQIYFDNKLFSTVSPIRNQYGVVHRGLAVINFDEITSLQGKTMPAWEGALSGLEIFRLVKGTIRKKERAFAFVNNAGTLEIWEIFKDGQGYYDQYTTVAGGETTITRVAIEPFLETRSDDFQSPFTPKLLNMGEVYLDDLVDEVTITVKFRPDQYPSWVTWATISLCANVSQCTITAPSGFTCSVWTTRQKQYAARVTLPMPSESCNTIAGIPLNIGHEFQFRFEGTGHFQLRRFRAHAIPQTQETEGLCPPAQATCKTFEACDTKWFDDFDSHGP